MMIQQEMVGSTTMWWKKRKCLKKENRKIKKLWKSCYNRGKQRNKRWKKKTKITTKMKEKNDKKKNI
jgi:hypothetical protein